MRWWLVALALTLPMILTGCGSGQDEAVRERAGAFHDAVSSGDWARACALLAPQTRAELEAAAKRPCEGALAEEEIPAPAAPERVDVFGGMARVTYRGETQFLTRFADGWRLHAVGCTSQAPRPYDCAVHGG